MALGFVYIGVLATFLDPVCRSWALKSRCVCSPLCPTGCSMFASHTQLILLNEHLPHFIFYCYNRQCRPTLCRDFRLSRSILVAVSDTDTLRCAVWLPAILNIAKETYFPRIERARKLRCPRKHIHGSTDTSGTILKYIRENERHVNPPAQRRLKS